MFNPGNRPLAPFSHFVRRVVEAVSLAGLIVLAALLLGVAGYHWIANFAWIDALLNASMILGGMGPVNELTTNAGKLFASAYALFSGLIFVAVMGIVISPIVHRMLHRFHLDDQDWARATNQETQAN